MRGADAARGEHLTKVFLLERVHAKLVHQPRDGLAGDGLGRVLGEARNASGQQPAARREMRTHLAAQHRVGYHEPRVAQRRQRVTSVVAPELELDRARLISLNLIGGAIGSRRRRRRRGGVSSRLIRGRAGIQHAKPRRRVLRALVRRGRGGGGGGARRRVTTRRPEQLLPSRRGIIPPGPAGGAARPVDLHGRAHAKPRDLFKVVDIRARLRREHRRTRVGTRRGPRGDVRRPRPLSTGSDPLRAPSAPIG